LHDQLGESIGETLIALLISSLALLMLAGAISTAGRIITRNKNSMNSYYETEQRTFESDWDSKVATAWSSMEESSTQTSQQSVGGGS